MQNSVTEKVAKQIAELGPRTEDAVVETLVGRELKKQSDALVILMDRIRDLENDLRRLEKPDENKFERAADGSFTAIPGFFSKERVEKINKQNQQIEKLVKAVNKALEKQDFGDVYNLVNQKQGGGGNSQEASGDPAE